MGSYLDQVLQQLKKFEGSVPWMYLDTTGKVTVGVGAMLPDAHAAGALPFLIGEQAATLDQIATDFRRVVGLGKGHLAPFYRRGGGPRLSEETIEARLADVLQGFEGYLRNHIHGYQTLPDSAKIALLDMVYNLGPGRLFSEYPSLIAAVEKGDWAAAARQSLRKGPGPARNAWTRQQFLAAAKQISIGVEGAAEQALRSVSWGWLPVLATAGVALLIIQKLTQTPRTRPARP